MFKKGCYRPFSPVFRVILPVTSIPWKASAKATSSAVIFGGLCIGLLSCSMNLKRI